MMRLVQRTTLLFASLLVIAATAHAECAWVLWEQLTVRETGTTNVGTADWKTVWGGSAAAGCDQEMRQILATVVAPPGDTTKVEHNINSVTISNPLLTVTTRYVCLPDTVDPRGPKGK